MLARRRHGILGGIVLPLTTRDAFDHGVVVRIVEKHQRLTTAHGGRFHGWIHHAVQSGNPVVIRPASHEIAEIYDETAYHNGHVYPDSSLGVHLEPTRFVLGLQDGETPIVAMGAGPELPRLRRHLRGGIIPHPQTAD